MITVISVLLILAGIIISAINLPGSWLVFIGVLISSISDGFSNIPPWLMVIFFVVVVVASVLDNLIVLAGAKKYGASKWGLLGAFVGTIVGMIIGNFLGLFVGPLFGALLFEYLFARKKLEDALQSGVGAMIGMIFAIIIKLGVSVLIGGIWLVLKIF